MRERIRTDVADRAIRRDLLRLGVDVERLRELFVYLVQDSGSIFNAATRARDLSADPRSVAQWAALLEDTDLIKRLRRHTSSAAARLRSQPRLYASDHGLITAFTPGRSVAQDQTARGRIIEAVVYSHLRTLARDLHAEITFFRQNDDLEADFVLELANKRIVVEVTGSTVPPREKVHRLIRAGESMRTKHLVMIYGGAVDDRRSRPVSLLSLLRFLLEPTVISEVAE